MRGARSRRRNGSRSACALLCASELITIGTPASAARRAFTSFRSRRSGLALISRNVPVSAACATSCSTFTAYGSRCRILRPVGWPMTSTSGWSIAAIMRFVISLLAHAERRVHRGHDPVQLLEHVVRIVQRPVDVDVHLGAGQHREAVQLLVQRAYALDLPQQLVRLHVVAEAVRGGVVRDGEVLVAALLGRLGHVLEGAAPVRQRRVGVQVALQVGLGDQLRQLPRQSRPAARRGPRAAPAR